MGESGEVNAYWANTPETLSSELSTSLDKGLTPEEAASRLNSTGPNKIGGKKKDTPLILFLNQFKNPIVLILIFATLVSALLGDWADAIIILMIVTGSALLSFYQEYSASSAAEKLRDQVSVKSQVIRGGETLTIPTEEVVPGDVVMLSAGSLIPADGVVIEAKDFFVSQSVLTGETFPVEKKPDVTPASASLADRTNVVFMGTSVRSGSAKALIVETGSKTAFGQIAGRLVLRPPETEFERGIRSLGNLLTQVMLILVLGIFAFNVYFHKPVIDSLLFSIALAVGLTPQLLPAIININLAKGSQAMAKQGVIVRRLESIENFGSMDVLCTDKTGTITAGVVQLDGAVDPQGTVSSEVQLYSYMNAKLQTGLSNPLDEAIVRKETPGAEAYKKIDEIPYDFNRKRLSVVVEKDGQNTMITKGALEGVLSVSNCVRLNSEEQPLDEACLADLNSRFEQWSSQGYRVLGVAIKSVPPQAHSYQHSDEIGMTFIGFLLFFDPPKPGVEATIQDLENLGVQLKIITGDNRLVARHTAEAVGLDGAQAISGDDLDRLHDDALLNAANRTSVFAEVDPNQKERLILALKKQGHVVGYLGDGINDAPSLHSADVGISVDNAVDVAKEAADLVLLRQDLNVLREGIIQGRKTFANTHKYVFMATSANFGNMFSMAIASLFLPFLPMLPKQILLINFLTDFPEMTIATDNVDDEYVQKPHRWDMRFIRRFMTVFGPLSSIFDLATFAVLLWVIHAGPEVFHTGWFMESVISACLVVFALRTRLPIFKSNPSKLMLMVSGLVVLVTLALPFTPLAAPLGFTPLPLTYVLILLGIVTAYLISAELTKRWFYRHLA